MASHSSIKASDSGFGECVKKIALKDCARYGPLKAKPTFILDEKDCSEIVNGTELEPNKIDVVVDLDHSLDHMEENDKRQLEIKDFRKRSKKVASLIIQKTNRISSLALSISPLCNSANFHSLIPRPQPHSWPLRTLSLSVWRSCP